MNAEEARSRLLQAYDEEVTIRRTLPRTFRERRLFKPPRRDKTAGGRLCHALQRNASLTASPLAAPRAPGKKQEMSELANSLEKKRVKVELWLVREKLPEQLAVSSTHAGTRSPRRYPDAHTKQTTQM